MYNAAMKAFYAGSFDPFTNGHLYVVRQAAQLFEEVIIGLGVNSEKRRHFSSETMVGAIAQTLAQAGIRNARAIAYETLTSVAAKAAGADVLIRGLRNGVDYDFEENLAALNQKLSGLETMYFRAGETAHISSSMVMELVRYGADVGELVPPAVRALMR